MQLAWHRDFSAVLGRLESTWGGTSRDWAQINSEISGMLYYAKRTQKPNHKYTGPLKAICARDLSTISTVRLER